MVYRVLVASSLRLVTLPACLALVLATAGLTAPGCTSAKKRIDVPLILRATAARHYPVVAFSPALKLNVQVIDERTQINQIGENIELSNSPPRPIFATGADPATFIREAIERELSDLGVNVVRDASSANRTLAFSIVKFYSVESNNYNTDVRANVQVKDGSGAVRFSGLVTGSNRRFGRSMSVDNYQEGFSDATIDMLAKLLNTADFQQSITP